MILNNFHKNKNIILMNIKLILIQPKKLQKIKKISRITLVKCKMNLITLRKSVNPFNSHIKIYKDGINLILKIQGLAIIKCLVI